MLEEGGYKSLWRGNGIGVLKIAPEWALRFMAYDEVSRLFLILGSAYMNILFFCFQANFIIIEFSWLSIRIKLASISKNETFGT